MSLYPIQPITLGGVHTYPLASRKSKVNVRDFAKPAGRASSLAKFLDSLPSILAAKDLRELATSIRKARKRKRAILWGIGGHVIKVGLGPVLIDLMQKGFVSGIAMNGAALIHDFEIAMVGTTSEEVAAGLGEGQFGMARETGSGINEIAKLAHRVRMGYGEAAGQYLLSGMLEPKHPHTSVLVAAYKQKIPVTIHLAIGTDIPHMHPAVDGGALGSASHYDFRLFQLGIGRDAPRGFSQGGLRCAQSRCAPQPHHDRQFRLYPTLPPAAECRPSPDDRTERDERPRLERLRHHGPP